MHSKNKVGHVPYSEKKLFKREYLKEAFTQSLMLLLLL